PLPYEGRGKQKDPTPQSPFPEPLRGVRERGSGNGFNTRSRYISAGVRSNHGPSKSIYKEPSNVNKSSTSSKHFAPELRRLSAADRGGVAGFDSLAALDACRAARARAVG